MAAKSSVSATGEQRATLAALAASRDRGEADRARAVLLTLAGPVRRFAEAFCVHEDTVRLWRSDFAGGGVEALKATVAPGPAPVKSVPALRVAMPLLEEPGADRRNWTIPRLRAEIEVREGVRISRSQLSKALRKKVPLAATAAHAEGTPDRQRGGAGRPSPATAQTAGGSGRHRSLYGDGSEALTHPYLARAWAKSGRICASRRRDRPGRSRCWDRRSCHAPTRRPHQSDQAQQRLRRPSRATRSPFWSQTGPAQPCRWSRSTPASSRWRRLLLAHTGSPSSGCPSMHRNDSRR